MIPSAAGCCAKASLLVHSCSSILKLKFTILCRMSPTLDKKGTYGYRMKKRYTTGRQNRLLILCGIFLVGLVGAAEQQEVRPGTLVGGNDELHHTDIVHVVADDVVSVIYYIRVVVLFVSLIYFQFIILSHKIFAHMICLSKSMASYE